MTSRRTSIAAAVVTIVLVASQFVLPGRDLFHAWQYALALAVLAWVLIAYAAGALRGEDGEGGKRMAVAMLGALVVVATGFASGLLGADTIRIARAPGTVAPVPELGAAAFFTNVDARRIAAGTAQIVLRRRSQSDLAVGAGSRKILGAMLVMLDPRPAAYLEAADARGNRLTITQPTGSSFLSPVLLFGNSQAIAGVEHPVDALTLPAADRGIKAVYFAADQTAQLRLPPEDAGKPALLYDVFVNSNSKQLGIVIAPSERVVELWGVRLRATVGSYPQLVVASVPQPYAFGFGVALFIGGIVAAGTLRTKTTMPASSGATKPAPSERRA